jgi:hypothetical protein
MRNLPRYFVAAILLLAACSGDLDGEYTDESGMFTYNFKSNGLVEMTQKAPGRSQTHQMHYRLEEGVVKLGREGGPQQVIRIEKDGCLDAGSPMGRMCKKK